MSTIAEDAVNVTIHIGMDAGLEIATVVTNEGQDEVGLTTDSHVIALIKVPVILTTTKA